MAYLKTRPAWIQLLAFMGLALGIFLIIGIIGLSILSNYTGIHILDMADPGKLNSKDPQMLTYLRGAVLVQFLGLFFIPSLVFAYVSDPKPMDYIGLKRPDKAIYYLLGFSVLLFALPLVDWLGAMNREVNFPKNIEKWMQQSEK